MLVPEQLTLDQLRRLSAGGQRVALDDACWPKVEAAAQVVAAAARGAAAVYGVNTGFGKLASTRIAPAQIDELQRRLVLSHMCGLGPALPDPVVRLVLALKAASLAQGHSGVARRDHRAAADPARARRAAGDPGQGLGRRLGRSRPARPPRRLPARPGRDPAWGRAAAGRRGAGAARRSTAPPRRQGGPGAAQRHPGLDRARADRLVPGGGGARGGAGRRRAERRCRARQRRAVRSAPQPGARPARPDPGRGAPARSCSRAARSAPRTWSTASASRTPTACAASRR